MKPNAHPGLSPIQRVYNDQAGSPHYRDRALVVGQTTTPEAKTEDALQNGSDIIPKRRWDMPMCAIPVRLKDQFPW